MDQVGERFSAIPSLVREVHRFINNYDGSCVGLQQLATQVNDTKTILCYILELDIHETVVSGVTHVLEILQNCQNRLDLINNRHDSEVDQEGFNVLLKCQMREEDRGKVIHIITGYQGRN